MWHDPGSHPGTKNQWPAGLPSGVARMAIVTVVWKSLFLTVCGQSFFVTRSSVFEFVQMGVKTEPPPSTISTVPAPLMIGVTRTAAAPAGPASTPAAMTAVRTAANLASGMTTPKLRLCYGGYKCPTVGKTVQGCL